MDARRWRQFSLKSLFCAMTVLALILAVSVSAFRRKSQCLKRLHNIGAQVGFDYQFTPDHKYRPNATPPGNDVLKCVMGEYYASNPTEIHVMGSGNASRGYFTDDDARLVSEFQELRWLVLQDTKMTDRGLAHLVHLTKLERLDLEGSSVTAEGIRKFKRRLPNVKVFCDDDLER